MAVANIKGEFSGGNLLLVDKSTGNTLASFRTGRPNEYDEYFLNGRIASAENSGSTYIPIPNSGTVVNIQVVPEATASASVSFTGLVSSTSAMTHDSFTIASGATAGTVSSVAPSAENEVDEGEAVLVRAGGEVTDSLPVNVVVTVRRT